MKTGCGSQVESSTKRLRAVTPMVAAVAVLCVCVACGGDSGGDGGVVTPAGQVSGVVVATTVPLPNVTVTCASKTAVTDYNGRYLLNGIPEGPQSFEVSWGGSVRQTVQHMVDHGVSKSYDIALTGWKPQALIRPVIAQATADECDGLFDNDAEFDAELKVYRETPYHFTWHTGAALEKVIPPDAGRIVQLDNAGVGMRFYVTVTAHEDDFPSADDDLGTETVYFETLPPTFDEGMIDPVLRCSKKGWGQGQLYATHNEARDRCWLNVVWCYTPLPWDP